MLSSLPSLWRGMVGLQPWQILSENWFSVFPPSEPDLKISPGPPPTPGAVPTTSSKTHECIVSWSDITYIRVCRVLFRMDSPSPTFWNLSFLPSFHSYSRLKLYLALPSCSILDTKAGGLFKYAYWIPFCIIVFPLSQHTDPPEVLKVGLLKTDLLFLHWAGHASPRCLHLETPTHCGPFPVHSPSRSYNS